MSRAHPVPIYVRNSAAVMVALCLATAMLAAPADAQSGATEPRATEAPKGPSGQDAKPAPPLVQPPAVASPPTAAEPPGRKAKSPDRLPQTAEEKSRLLADLYAHLQTADDEEAAKKVAEAIERLWQHSGSDTVNLLMQRSSKAITDKKIELAQKLLDAIVGLAPDYPEGFNQRAYFYFTQNNYEAAVGDLRRALALDPNHYKALEGLAQIWRDTGNKKGAFRVMQQLLDVHPHAAGAKQIYEDLKREVDGQGI